MTAQARVGGTRVLTYETWGPSDGRPVFLLHGSPGSRLGPRPRRQVLDLMGIRLVAFDRPGYGGSDRLRGRRVVDAAQDVEAIADHLGLDRFAIVGRSGGAPHALACAAHLKGGVVAAASLAGLAPRDADGLDWLEGMGESNRREHGAAWEAIDSHQHGRLLSRLVHHSGVLQDAAAEFLQSQHGTEMPADDQRILNDAGIRHLLAENFRLAVAEGNLRVPDPREFDTAIDEPVLLGWLDDTLAFAGDWGFKVEEIDVPVLLWHGEQDVFSPVSHSRWLAERIDNAELEIEPDTAHFRALEAMPKVLWWLACQF
jgi:pimeloyl-ACP methyl ester carboxylesterase